MLQYLLTALIFTTIVGYGGTINKYSKEANLNQPSEKQWVVNPKTDFRSLDKPFRMAKLNLLWSKAQRVIKFDQRLKL